MLPCIPLDSHTRDERVTDREVSWAIMGLQGQICRPNTRDLIIIKRILSIFLMLRVIRFSSNKSLLCCPVTLSRCSNLIVATKWSSKHQRFN